MNDLRHWLATHEPWDVWWSRLVGFLVFVAVVTVLVWTIKL